MTREIRVGLVVAVGLVGLVGLLCLAGGGPGFLTSRRTIDVVFRDGQGLRVGSPVRIAGIDSGRVVGIDLVPVDGRFGAVRIALPTDLAGMLRQDVKITVQASLTGQNCVNILSSGRSKVALVPGQVVQGFETSLFDPVLDQIGLGPAERSHLSKTIETVRRTVDVVGPRLSQILGSLQDTTGQLRETSEKIRPVIETAVETGDDLVRRLAASAPKIEATLVHIEALTAKADGLVAENRPEIRATLASVRDLTSTLNDMLAKDRAGIDRLVVGLEETRRRADRFLYNAEILSGQGVDLVARNRAYIDRIFANVRDITESGHQLIDKIYGFPFYLNPFYKPTPEDKRAQVVFDNAQTLGKSIRDLADAIKKIESLQALPASKPHQQEINQLYQSAQALSGWLTQATQKLARDLQTERPRR